MTIASTTTKQTYSCNGSTVDFDFTFPVFAGSDLLVIKRTIASGLEETLVLNTDYTTSAANNDYSSGGRVTLTTAPSSSYQLIVMRNLSATQETAYDEGDAFPAATHEQALDKLTMLQQQANGDLNRALRVPKTDTDVAELPSEASRASKYLAFDANGDPIASTSLPTSTDITNLLLGSRYATLAAAVTAAGSTPSTILLDTSLPIGSNCAIPATLCIESLHPGGSVSGNGTITGTNGKIKAGRWQVFGSSITLAGTWAVAEVYPQWFGAKGDGTTDDTASVQKALAIGSVCFPPGSYAVSNLSVPNDSSVFGPGTIKCPASGTGFNVTGDRVTISGLSFSGNAATYAVSISGDDASVHDCRFSGNVGHYIISSGNRTSISNNVFDGSSATSIVTPVVISGPYPDVVVGHKVIGNGFYDTVGFGVQTRLGVENAVIANNCFHQPAFTQSITATAGQTVFNFTLSKVVARLGVQVDGVPTSTGVTITGSGPAYTATFSGGRSAGEVVKLIGFRSLEPLNINSNSYDISINGNAIDGSGDSGIVLCADYHDGVLQAGADAGDFPDRIAVIGNTVKNCAYAGIVQTVPVLTGCLIIGNSITDASMIYESGYFSSGIAFGGSNVTCQGNILNNASGWMDNGIWVGTYSSAGPTDPPSVLMGGNAFSGSFTKTYTIPQGEAALRKRSILITDGFEVQYPESPNLDSVWTNYPADTGYLTYAKSGGTGWTRDTSDKIGGTASLETVAGEYVEVALLSSGMFSDSIIKVEFWAKAAAASSGYLSVFTLLGGTYVPITATVTDTSWKKYTLLVPHEDLTVTGTFLRIGGTAGTVNIQHLRLAIIKYK